MSEDDSTATDVLLIGRSDRAEALESALPDERGPCSDVAAARTIADALDALRTTASGVDCAVIDVATVDREWTDVVDAITEFDPDLPLVLCLEAPDPATTRAAFDAGVEECAVAPSDGGAWAPVAQAVLNAAVADAKRDREREEAIDMLNTLFEKLPVFLYFKDDEARFVRVPDIYWGDEPPLGKTLADLEDEWGFEMEHYRDDLHVLETGEPIINKEIEKGSFPLAPVDQYMSTTKVPWRGSDGEIKGIAGIVYNITEQKEQEQQLERQNERLEEFASVVAHDLRNPLNVAMGLLDHALEIEDMDVVADAREPLDRMETLIEDLLTLARLGQTVSETERVLLSEIVREAWRDADTGSARLEIDDAVENDEFEADPSRLQQLFENLFRNAVDHAGPAATVRVGQLDDGFYVEDDGPGIPEDEREDVFEYGHTTSDDGTGVGLSIVRNIVDAHGWSIAAAESDEGGARFEITDADRYAGYGAADDDPASRERSIETCETVGATGGAGRVDVLDRGDEFVVTASGENIWQLRNQFHYVYERVRGDVDFVARVKSLEAVSYASKAGVMIRERLSEHSAHAFAGVLEHLGSEFLFAKYPEDRTESVPTGDDRRTPCWVRITREGDEFTGYVSSDGEEWTTIARRTIPMDEEVYVGLAACSGNTPGVHVPTTARFDSVSGLDEWENRDVGDVEIEGRARRARSEERALEGTGRRLCGPDAGGQHAFATLEGDATCTARVLSFEESDGGPADAAPEAGVLLRAGEGDETWSGAATLSPDGEAAFAWSGADGDYRRDVVDGEGAFAGSDADVVVPGLLRVERRGETVRAEYSRTGGEWTDLGTATLPADEPIDLGIAVASGSDERAATARFDLVEIEESG